MGQIRLAVIGKSKDANSRVARYFWRHHNFVNVGLDDEMDQFLRKILNPVSKAKPHLTWQEKQGFYDVWHEIKPEIWVNRAINLTNAKTRHVVVPDARYLNEVKALEAAGFVFVRVTVPRDFNYRNNFIKTINRWTGKDAITYYEWFKSDADNYVRAKYAIHFENLKITPYPALESLHKKLTEDKSIHYTPK